MTNAEARFNNSLLPRKPEGSLGRTAQDGHHDSHTAPELWFDNLKYIRACTCSINLKLTVNSSCDFDTFVRIHYECFPSAQRSYT